MCHDSRSPTALLFALAGLFLLLSPVGALPDVPTANSLALAAAVGSSSFACLAIAGGLSSQVGLMRGLGLRPSRLPAFSISLLLLGTVGASFLLDMLLHESGLREDSVLVTIEATLRKAQGPSLLVAALGMAVAPALGEEFLFRGLLLRALDRRFGWILATLLSSALFGIVHVDLAQGLGASVLGIYFALVSIATASVWPVVLCHLANNLSALLHIAVLPEGLSWEAPAAIAAVLGAIIVLARELPRTLPNWQSGECVGPAESSECESAPDPPDRA